MDDKDKSQEIERIAQELALKLFEERRTSPPKKQKTLNDDSSFDSSPSIRGRSNSGLSGIENSNENSKSHRVTNSKNDHPKSKENIRKGTPSETEKVDRRIPQRSEIVDSPQFIDQEFVEPEDFYSDELTLERIEKPRSESREETGGFEEERRRKRERDNIRPSKNSRTESDALFETNEEENRDDKRRRYDQKEKLQKSIREKIENEKNLLSEEMKHSSSANKDLYLLFNELQGISQEFGIDFETPEIVVVGMQSDGKSSFIEGLLGFQFNIVETNIGTRRPLILQMINNLNAETPICRFRKERLDPVEDEMYEAEEIPVRRLSEELIRRTNEIAGIGESVSDIPMVLRVEFKHCPNLTIYDTPGFRLGGEETLSRQIEQMNMKLMKPPNRIIVCLEQSTVEWANSVSRPLAKLVDPQFERTILVNTKFDNRVKELREKRSADNYLSGEQFRDYKPFFVSLPFKRNLDSTEFRESILDTYIKDYQSLLEVDFDEERFYSQLGFPKLRLYLEKTLYEKYKQSLWPTLRSLEDVTQRAESELEVIRKELERKNVEHLKSGVFSYCHAFVCLIQKLLQGTIIGNPDIYGQTLSEEKLSSDLIDWSLPPESDFDFDIEIENGHLKLYGGAQFSRLLNEFEFVAHSREFPKITSNEIASSLGSTIRGGHGVNSLESAASDIVQIKLINVLRPLIDILSKRTAYILKRLFDISLEILTSDQMSVSVSESETYRLLSVYPNFVGKLKEVYSDFVDDIEHHSKLKLREDFDTFTKIVDWSLLSGLSEIQSHNIIPGSSHEETRTRVRKIMGHRPILPLNGNETDENLSSSPLESHSRFGSRGSDVHTKVCVIASKLFAGIRFFFVKYMRNKTQSFFLDPIYSKLGVRMTEVFSKLTHDDYEELFSLGLSGLKEKSKQLEAQLVHCRDKLQKFKHLSSELCQQLKENENVDQSSTKNINDSHQSNHHNKQIQERELNKNQSNNNNSNRSNTQLNHRTINNSSNDPRTEANGSIQRHSSNKSLAQNNNNKSDTINGKRSLVRSESSHLDRQSNGHSHSVSENDQNRSIQNGRNLSLTNQNRIQTKRVNETNGSNSGGETTIRMNGYSYHHQDKGSPSLSSGTQPKNVRPSPQPQPVQSYHSRTNTIVGGPGWR